MVEIILFAIIIAQTGIIVGLVYIIVLRTDPQAVPTVKKSLLPTDIKVEPVTLPTAEQLEEESRPKGEVEAENAMRSIFKKISGI